MPRVSIITPCYNAGAYVRSMLDSVAAQTLADWELVVVDDGSTDGSAAIVEAAAGRDGRVRLVRQPNAGVSAARNAGFRAAAADSEYLLFLDADDELEPTMLERLAEYLDERPDAGMAYCRPVMIGDDGSVASDQWWPPRLVRSAGKWGIRELPEDQPLTPWAAIYALAGLVPSLALLRRSTYASTPGWDETLGQPCEDTDLFLHMGLYGAVHYVPEALVRRRVHAQQSVADVDHLDAQRERLYEKWRALAAAEGGPVREVREGDDLVLNVNLVHRMTEAADHLRGGRLVRAARYAGGAARRFAFPLLLRRRAASEETPS